MNKKIEDLDPFGLEDWEDLRDTPANLVSEVRKALAASAGARSAIERSISQEAEQQPVPQKEKEKTHRRPPPGRREKNFSHASVW